MILKEEIIRNKLQHTQGIAQKRDEAWSQKQEEGRLKKTTCQYHKMAGVEWEMQGNEREFGIDKQRDKPISDLT